MNVKFDNIYIYIYYYTNNNYVQYDNNYYYINIGLKRSTIYEYKHNIYTYIRKQMFTILCAKLKQQDVIRIIEIIFR